MDTPSLQISVFIEVRSKHQIPGSLRGFLKRFGGGMGGGGFDRYEGMNVRIEPVSMLFSLLSSVILGDRLGDRGFVSFFFFCGVILRG